MWASEGPRHAMQVIGSFVFFQWLNEYLSPQLSQYFPSYNNLTSEKRAEWHSRTCSSVHAVLVSFACVYVVIADEESKKDTVWGDSWFAKSNIAFATGYLLSDLYMFMTNFKNIGGTWGYVGHHLSAVYAYSYVLIYGVLGYYANFRLLAEISTPFVNLRWIYDISGRKSSQAYFINGLFLTGTFFVCRILAMPYYYYLVYSTFGTEEFHRLGTVIQVSWIGSCILLDILNVVWFYKIFRGARKVMKSKRSSEHLNGNGNVQVPNNNVEKMDQITKEELKTD